MIRRARPDVRLTSVLSTAFIYLVSISTILVLSFQYLRSPKGPEGTPSTVILALVFLIPGVLSVTAIVRFASLFAERVRKVPGSRLRLKISLAFVVVTGFACAPQAILLLISEYALVDTWYSSGFREAIDAGNRVSVMLWNEKRNQLLIAQDRDLRVAAARYGDDLEAVLETLQARNPDIVALQSVSARGDASRFAGERTAELPAYLVARSADGLLPSDTVGTNSFLRAAKRISSAREGERVFLATLKLSEDFTLGSSQLFSAREDIDLMLSFRPRFKWIVLAFYCAIAFPLLLIAILAGVAVAETLTTPIRALSRAADRVASGDLSVRVINAADDELADFSQKFNQMLAELRRSGEDALQSEKITVWQDIAQKLAHELKNPLTPIKLSAERVLRRYGNDPAAVGEIVEPAMLAIIQEVDRLASMLSDFRNFAKLPEPQFAWTALAALADQTAASYRTSWPGVTIDLSGIDPDLKIRVDEKHIRQVLVNLYGNAIEAMEGTGTIRISAELVKKGDSGYCRMRISDSGPGIPPELRDKIFTPYFTTKAKGTGLGLSIVAHIVIDHGGEIRFETETGEGTTFIVDLPVDPGTRTGAPATTTED